MDNFDSKQELQDISAGTLDEVGPPPLCRVQDMMYDNVFEQTFDAGLFTPSQISSIVNQQLHLLGHTYHHYYSAIFQHNNGQTCVRYSPDSAGPYPYDPSQD